MFFQFKVGVSWHPSHPPISGLVGEEERALLAPVTCPQLFMPAAGDHANTFPGGLGEQARAQYFAVLYWTIAHFLSLL